MEKIETIKNNELYKRVLKDSIGGLIYNVANHYDSEELLATWDSLTPSEQESTGGIMKGAMRFLKEQAAKV